MGLDSGSVDLGSAFGTIGIGFDEQGIGAAMDRIERTVAGRLNSLGQNFQRIGGQMTVALAPITGFATKGILAYAKFDDILTEIEARTGATATEMEAVRAKALQMGQDTAFSASDASQAMLELLSSGSSLNETMSMLPDVLNLAAAGNLNLGHSADAVTDILAQFQLDASRSADVVNALAGASQSSSATINDLILAFANVGPIAAGFKISVEDTAAALAVLAENGIKGSEAGTAFKSMLLNMTRDTDDVVSAWDTLGTSFTDAEGNMRDLDSVIDDINAGLEGMTEEERLSVINDLAGNYGQTALMALLASEGIDEMQESMDGSTDASVLAAAKMASFRGIIRQVGSSIETLMLNMLGPLVDDYLKPLAATVVLLLNKFNEWLVANPMMAEALGLLIAQLAIAGPLIFSLGTALVFITSPMLIAMGVVLALAAAVSLLAVAWKNNLFGIQDIASDVADRVIEAFDRMRTMASSSAAMVAGIFGAGGIAGLASGFDLTASNALMLIRLLPMLMSPLGALVLLAGAVGWAIQTNFLGIGDKARPVIEGLASAFDRVKLAAERVKSAFDAGGLQTALSTTTGEMQSMFTELQTRGKAVFDTFFQSTLPNAVATAQTIGPQLWGWVNDTLPQASFMLGEAAGSFSRILGEALIAHGPTVFNAFVEVVSWVATTGIPAVAGLLFAAGVAFLDGFVSGLLGQDTTLLAALNTLAGNIINWIITQGPTFAANLLTWATEFSQWVVAATPGLILQLAMLWVNLQVWVLQKAAELGVMVAPFAWEFTKWVTEAWFQLLPKLFMLWLNLQAWVVQKAIELPGMMYSWLVAFTGWTQEAMPVIRQKLNEWWGVVRTWVSEKAPLFAIQLNRWQQAIVEWVEDSVPALLQKLEAWLVELINWISSKIETVQTAAASVGEALVDGLRNGINAKWGDFVSFLEAKYNDLPGVLRSVIEAFSPSRVFMRIGEDVVEGLRIGLADNESVMNTMAGLAHGMQQPITAAVPGGAGPTSIQNASSVRHGDINVHLTPPSDMTPDRAYEIGRGFGQGIREQLQWELRKNQ